jgi:hypothetical protein
MLLFNGLGIANHLLALLTAPVLIFVLSAALRKRELPLRHAGLAVGLWVLGSLPYTALVAGELFRTGDLPGTLHSALFGQSFAGEVLNTTLRLRSLTVNAGFVVLNFPSLLLPLALWGLVRGRRLGVPTVAWAALFAGLVIHLCFACRYNVVDQHTFFLPSYVLLSIFAGVGMGHVSILTRPRVRLVAGALAVVMLASTPPAYIAARALARRLDVLRGVARDKPYRDDYVYLFTPWSVVERSAERMSRHAVELAGERGLIFVEDPMAAYAVRYRVLRAGRGDVRITEDVTPDRFRRAVARNRTVVLVPARVSAPQTVPPTGAWHRVGDLYVLVAEPPSGNAARHESRG